MQVLKSQLFVDKFAVSVQHTFLDYLAGGYELNFMVAIDFTGAQSCLRCHTESFCCSFFSSLSVFSGILFIYV